jgi:hypothetical protein
LDAPETYPEKLAQLEEYYQNRRDLILSNTELTEQDRTALETELTNERNVQLKRLEADRMSYILTTSADIASGLSRIAKGFAGEQSGIYKAMFAASQAFAVADATIKIQQGIANAASLPFPANLGAISSVVTATAGILETINGTNFSGAYDKGGMIPAGKVGLVGEYGPELVQGPANVTGRKETAEMLRSDQNATAPVVNLRAINVLDPSVLDDYIGSDRGEEVIVNVIRNNPELIRSMAGG